MNKHTCAEVLLRQLDRLADELPDEYFALFGEVDHLKAIPNDVPLYRERHKEESAVPPQPESDEDDVEVTDSEGEPFELPPSLRAASAMWNWHKKAIQERGLEALRIAAYRELNLLHVLHAYVYMTLNLPPATLRKEIQAGRVIFVLAELGGTCAARIEEDRESRDTSEMLDRLPLDPATHDLFNRSSELHFLGTTNRQAA